jgi:NADPH2:quinone reductase
MKALVSEAPGGPETLVLREATAPEPGAGEVLVEVRACALNFPDTLIIRDLYQVKPPRPFSPGSEVAGVVLRTGSGVDGFAPGDRVIARTTYGGLAEQLVASAEQCFPLPDAMDFATGAALLMTYGTSYHALHQRAGLKRGETLLVLGASGGVGLAAVELGRDIGARVVAAASSEEKLALARSAGAHAGFVYPTGPFDSGSARELAALFKAELGAAGADVIYDPVGGAYAEAAFRAINWGGRFLVVGFPAGIPKIALNLPLLKGASICGVFNGGLMRAQPDVQRRNCEELLRLCVAGRIRPRISERVGLADAPAAIQRLADRQATGKLVVEVA